MLDEKLLEDFVSKYVKDGDVVAVGSSKQGEDFLKKLAVNAEEKNLKIRVIPTSLNIASIVSGLGLEIASLNEDEVDLAIEFVDMVDKDFNFIKRNSLSLVRDKMIAQCSDVLIVVTDKRNFVERLYGMIPFEVCIFGWKRTLIQLGTMGKANLRMHEGKPFKTETNHYIIDVDVEEIFSLEDTEFHSKNIPGVLETGLFVGYADKVMLLGEKEIEVKSRL